MKRLTKRNKEGFAYFHQCFEEPCCGNGPENDCDDCGFMVDVCRKLARYEDIGTLEEVRDALERQEKYRWHNLNKDPEDLPKNLSKIYLFENKWGQVFKGTFRIVGNIKLFETHIYSKVHGGDIWLQYKTCNVVRWKEIEPMEE